jgi:hypothetical protein
MMLWILAVALVGLVFAVVAVIESRILRVELRESEASLASANDELKFLEAKRVDSENSFKALAQRVTELELTLDGSGRSAPGATAGGLPAEFDERLAERSRQAAAALAGLRRWADDHFTAVAGDAAQTAQLVQRLERFAIRSLEFEAAAARPGSLVLSCRLYAEQPCVLDIAPGLLGHLWTALGAEVMYKQDDRRGTRFFLRWPSGSPMPRLKLGSLLREAASGSSVAQAQSGSEELQAVIRALHAGGPAVMQLGPLLLARTSEGTYGGFVSPDWPGVGVDPLAAAIAGQPIEAMGAQDVVGLTEWSDELTPVP